jgi:hypothetical protein
MAITRIAATRTALTTPRSYITGFEAYGIGKTTARLEWTGTGNSAAIYRKLASEADTEYAQIAVRNSRGWLNDTIPTEGESYDYKLVDDYGRGYQLRLPMPYTIPDPSETHTYNYVWTPTLDPDGVLYAMTQPYTDEETYGDIGLRKSSDGGATWTDVIVAGGPSRIYIYSDYIWMTSMNAWATKKGKLYTTPIDDPGTWTEIVDFWEMDSDHPTDVYQWGFGVTGGDRMVLGAAGQYGDSETTWTDDNSNNRLYVTDDLGENWTASDYWPTGSTYSRHIHIVSYNPVSDQWLISVGEPLKRTYLCSSDLSDYTLIASGTAGATGVSGGNIGVVALPDGGWIVGSDDATYGHIIKVDSSGTCRRVLSLPQTWGAEIWDIRAFATGEVWAASIYAVSPFNKVHALHVSHDWGETWRKVWQGDGQSVMCLGEMAHCHHTGLIEGDYVTIAGIGFSKPGHVWKKIGTPPAAIV